MALLGRAPDIRGATPVSFSRAANLNASPTAIARFEALDLVVELGRAVPGVGASKR